MVGAIKHKWTEISGVELNIFWSIFWLKPFKKSLNPDINIYNEQIYINKTFQIVTLTSLKLASDVDLSFHVLLSLNIRFIL